MCRLHSLPAVLLFGILFGLCGAFPPSDTRAQDQNDDQTYVQHSYMNVPEGGAEAYETVERELWKPIHRQRLQDGTIEGWRLYEVVSPSGADYKRDYVTVTFYDDWAPLESPFSEAHFQEAHPNRELSSVVSRTDEARTLIHTDLVQVVDEVSPSEGENGGIADYIRADFMKVPPYGGAEYVNMEQNVWKPIHEVLIEHTEQAGWFLVERQFTGANEPYQYITIQPYTSWSGLDPSPLGETQQKEINADVQEALPDSVLDGLYERTADTRTLVRTEIWRLIDHVSAEE